MPAYIIHKDGAYNVFSTLTDTCWFNSALTLDELKEWYRHEHGESGMRELDDRLERARAKGSSDLMGCTLETWVKGNRAGPREGALSMKKFVTRFLTLPEPASSSAREGRVEGEMRSRA